MIARAEVEEKIGHTIRNDTYLFIARILEGEKYADIFKDLSENRDKYGIEKYWALSKEDTIAKYIKQINGETIEIKKENLDPLAQDYGIYGIFLDGELVYIGQTRINFEQRFKQHKSNMKVKNTEMYLYRYLNPFYHSGVHNLTFRVLISSKSMPEELTQQ